MSRSPVRLGLILTAGALILLGVWTMTSPPHSSFAQEEADHHAQLKNPDGSWKYTNDLIHETSPYLLQHAHNPVQWHAWGPKAFEMARQTGKPIFLSVGYSTCYWCHVMERQCFENPQIAAVMNEHFINIKVDREERPDVDDIYMAAVQIFTRGRGGWPMSIFLTPPGSNPGGNKKDDADNDDAKNTAADPGLKPFFAGTYFPPTAQQGMPGFPQVLTGLADAWRNRRADVLQTADQVADLVRQTLSQRAQGGQLSPQLIQSAFNQLMRQYDQQHGGFASPNQAGQRAPKFPTPNNLAFLLAIQKNDPDDQLARAITHTLDRMARGGIYDQVGGGFHRYSVDEKWLVPHFEKMLYDNGQLLEIYCRAQRLQPMADDPQFYPRIVGEISEYVLREMRDPTGVFWSAQDAEVDAREGDNYVWTETQVQEAIGPPMDAKFADLAVVMYGLDQGTNFQDPHHPNQPPTNVLYLPQPLHELAKQRDTTLAELLQSRNAINQRLLAVRNQRKQPGTDDKALVAWNGLIIAGLADAGRLLNEPRYHDAAAGSADYILQHMRNADGGLYRTMRQEQVKIPAFLDDYAHLAHGLLALHRAGGETKWRDAAIDIMQQAKTRFASTDGGYYDTLADQADLFVRTRSFHDGAIPSANSQMVHNLIDLYEITRDRADLDDATQTLRSFAGLMEQSGAGMSHMTHALLRAAQHEPTVLQPAQNDGEQLVINRDQMHIEMSPAAIRFDANHQTMVRLTLTIAKGFHANSNQPGAEGVIPLTLTLQNGESFSLEVKYPPGEQKRFAFADQPLSVYEETVVIDAVLKRVGERDADDQPRLVLSYQICDDRTCLLPQTVDLPLRIAPSP